MATTVNVATVDNLFSQGPVTGFGSNAQARLEVNGQSVFGLRVSDQGLDTGSFSGTLSAAVRTNTVFLIEMYVRAWTFESGVSASAFLDPYFTLTPGQLAQGDALRFSDGAGNAAPVPEPTSACSSAPDWP